MGSQSGLVDDIKDYKFYIVGTVSGLKLDELGGGVTDYDINGEEIIDVTHNLLTRN